MGHERQLRPDAERSKKVLVFGAGEGGIQLVTAMLRNPSSPDVPVGLLDDNPVKRNLEILGIPVLGGRDDLAAAVARTGATGLVIAVPSADSSLIRELSQSAIDADLDVRVLPPLSEMLAHGREEGLIRVYACSASARLLGLDNAQVQASVNAILGWQSFSRMIREAGRVVTL